MSSRWARWWGALTNVDRYRIYTRLTCQGVLVGIAVAAAVAMDELWPAAASVVASVLAVCALEARPELSLWPGPRLRRVVTVASTALLALLLVGCVVATRGSAGAAASDGRSSAVYVVVMLALAVIPFLPWRWWILVGMAVAVGSALADSPSEAVRLTATVLAVGVCVVVAMLVSLWALRVVEDLEHARAAEARLQVAEERLRFSRDLHDVVGRGFSAVAVKSELASTLARAGERERAAHEMDEVKVLAVESMDQLRGLVRGYRGISLVSEVEGARSLLSSVGCRLTVEGDPDRVPERFHEVAAWVVREGTTNIVRHSSATVATLALGAEGMSLRNDAPRGAPGRASGQRGLAERLAAVGATMTTSSSDGTYVLDVRWEAP